VVTQSHHSYKLITAGISSRALNRIPTNWWCWHSDCLPALHSFLFQNSTSHLEGVIETRERKTNRQVRHGDTDLSTHTYLFLHLFVVLQFPSGQSVAANGVVKECECVWTHVRMQPVWGCRQWTQYMHGWAQTIYINHLCEDVDNRLQHGVSTDAVGMGVTKLILVHTQIGTNWGSIGV
jgi:hypothetical protein